MNNYLDRIKKDIEVIGVFPTLLIVIKRVFRMTRIALYTKLARVKLKLSNVAVGKNFRVDGTLATHIHGTMDIGESVRINSGYSNYVGGECRSAFWVGRSSTLSIGDDCALSNVTIVALEKVFIGKNVFIGGGTRIYDTNFHQISYDERVHGTGEVVCKPIHIEHGVFIGGHCIILKGVTIGRNSVVAAGSVVVKNIPENEVWGGNPARKISNLMPGTDAVAATS